jgi:hypothetical protein
VNVKKNIHRIIISGICIFALDLSATSMIDVKSVLASPDLYNAMDLKARNVYLSAAPFIGKSFDAVRMAEALTMNGKAYFTLNEQGAAGDSSEVLADMNPIIVGLTTQAGGTGNAGVYKSTVELKPEVARYGSLLHGYKKWDKFFVDVKSAVVSTQTQIKIIETGGGNGDFGSIKTFADAMSQSSRKYGKMGSLQKKIGVDNIQLMVGVINRFDQEGDNSAPSNNALTGYLLAEIPTGKASSAEWVFEPRVGSNHGAIGAGFEEYYINDTATIVVGANARHFFAAKETRSFDLKGKPWSRYLLVVSLPAALGAPGTLGYGIDSLTLNATVKPGQQVQAYLRWVKKWSKLSCELGYTFFYHRKETVSDVADFANSFGIYDTFAAIREVTASSADINTYKPVADNAANVAIVKDDLDLDSAAVGMIASSSVSARLEYGRDRMRLGIGGSVEAAHSRSAYAAWTCWMNLGVLF